MSVRLQRPSPGVRLAAQVEERLHARDADGDVGRPLPPGAAEGVGDDHRGRDAEAGGERVAEAARRRVRVAREQHHPVVAGRVRAVDARARADEAVLGLGDDELVAAAADGARLAQDHRQVVVGLLDPAFGLGDDLLGDDDDVPVGQAPGPLERVAEERGEIVARPHLGNPLEGNDLDHSGSPVTLTPAFVL